MSVPLIDFTGRVVTVWNTPVSEPVSSSEDGLLENGLPEQEAESLSNRQELSAEESHSMILIA